MKSYDNIKCAPVAPEPCKHRSSHSGFQTSQHSARRKRREALLNTLAVKLSMLDVLPARRGCYHHHHRPRPRRRRHHHHHHHHYLTNQPTNQPTNKQQTNKQTNHVINQSINQSSKQASKQANKQTSIKHQASIINHHSSSPLQPWPSPSTCSSRSSSPSS